MLAPIKKISILGCGWLGFPLALALLKDGYRISGSTTSEEKIDHLSAHDIEPYLIKVGKYISGNIADFFNTDLLILNIPPGRRRPEVETLFPQEIEQVLELGLSYGLQRLIFISSTGVYANTNRIMTELDPTLVHTGTGKALVQCEQFIKSIPDLSWIILRMAGLIGGDRKAGRFLAGKKELVNGMAPVNMVHRDDCIQIIRSLIQIGVWNEVFNVCADEHPLRREFYTKQALKQGFEPPAFLEDDHRASYKIIANQKLKKRLNYTFIHPDPMLF